MKKVLDPRLVGCWHTVRLGLSPEALGPVGTRQERFFIMRGDGTAEKGFVAGPTNACPEAPFPPRWWTEDATELVLASPIPPMPQYGRPDWSYSSASYEILQVAADHLLITDRPYDGEFVQLLERCSEEQLRSRREQAGA